MSSVMVTGAPSSELGYVELTSSPGSQTNTAYADTGLTIPTFTVGAQPVYVEFFMEECQVSTTAIPVFALTQSDNTVVKEATAFVGVNFAKCQPRLVKRLTAAGTYSGYKIRHKVNSGQSFTPAASLVGELVAWVRVFQV